MLIIIGFVIILIVGIFVLRSKRYDINRETVGIVLTVIGTIGLIVSLLTLPFSRMEVNSTIHKIEATQQTINRARENENIKLEKMAIQNKAAEMNQKLASTKYYNKTVFDLWIPDKIENVEPIK